MNTPYNITAKEYVPTFAYVPAVYPCAKVTNVSPWFIYIYLYFFKKIVSVDSLGCVAK